MLDQIINSMLVFVPLSIMEYNSIISYWMLGSVISKTNIISTFIRTIIQFIDKDKILFHVELNCIIHSDNQRLSILLIKKK